MYNKEIAVKVAKCLLQINAVKLSPQNPFTWASGLLSPIYCDNRLILSYPAARKFIIDCFRIKALAIPEVDFVAGVATAGIPHAALLAERLQLPMVYVRSKAKGHGRQNQIEGRLEEGAKVLLIEDLISTGGSSIRAVEALRDAGAEITATMAIFTYGFESAADTFEQADCRLDTLSNYDTLIEQAEKENYIDRDALESLKAWRKNPKAWSDQISNNR
jgi:orotate phosphoribosyltransferase